MSQYRVQAKDCRTVGEFIDRVDEMLTRYQRDSRRQFMTDIFGEHGEDIDIDHLDDTLAISDKAMRQRRKELLASVREMLADVGWNGDRETPIRGVRDVHVS